MTECVACDRTIRVSVTLGDPRRRYNMCLLHAEQLKNEELVDDLAREIYVEYLVQTKGKNVSTMSKM